MQEKRVNAELKKLTPSKSSEKKPDCEEPLNINKVKLDKPFSVKKKEKENSQDHLEETLQQFDDQKEKVSQLLGILEAKTEEYKLRELDLQQLQDTLESVTIKEVEVIKEKPAECDETSEEIAKVRKLKDEVLQQLDNRMNALKDTKESLFKQLGQFISDVQNKKGSDGLPLVVMPENFEDIVLIASEERSDEEKPFWVNYCKTKDEKVKAELEKIKHLDKILAEKTKAYRRLEQEIKMNKLDEMEDKSVDGVFITDKNNVTMRNQSLYKPKFDIRRATSAKGKKHSKLSTETSVAKVEGKLTSEDNEKVERMLEEQAWDDAGNHQPLEIEDVPVEDYMVKDEKDKLNKINEKLRSYHDPQEWSNLSLISTTSHKSDYLREMQEVRQEKENIHNIDSQISKLKQETGNSVVLSLEDREKLLEKCKQEIMMKGEEEADGN